MSRSMQIGRRQISNCNLCAFLCQKVGGKLHNHHGATDQKSEWSLPVFPSSAAKARPCEWQALHQLPFVCPEQQGYGQNVHGSRAPM